MATKSERMNFYAEYDALLEKCSHLRGSPLGPDDLGIVDAARTRFGYSQNTLSQDILYPLLRGWSTWRKERAASATSVNAITQPTFKWPIACRGHSKNLLEPIPRMMTRLKATKAERVAFYAEHDALLEKCSFMQGWFLGEDGQQLVKKARVRFKYSPATFTCDIMSTTVRGWTRGESKSTGPEEVSGDDGTWQDPLGRIQTANTTTRNIISTWFHGWSVGRKESHLTCKTIAMVELTLEWPIAYEGGLTTVLKVVQWPSIPAIGVCVVPERGHGPVPIEPVYIEISSCAGTVKLQAHEMVDTVEFDALIALLKEDGWYWS